MNVMNVMHRSIFPLLMALLLAAGLLAACVAPTPDAGAPPSPTPATDLEQEEERITAPDVPPSDLDELVQQNTAFAFDLYHAVQSEHDNLFYSPYSISMALAMTYAGARGQTAAQMSEALNFTLPEERLHPAFNVLDLELAERGKGPTVEEGDAFQLNVVNQLWGQSGYEFLQGFLDTLAAHYGAGMRLLFMIRDIETEAILFLGRVLDPSAGVSRRGVGAPHGGGRRLPVAPAAHQLLDPTSVSRKPQQHLVPNHDGRRGEAAHVVLELFHVALVRGDVPFFEFDVLLSEETLRSLAIRSGGLRVDDDFVVVFLATEQLA